MIRLRNYSVKRGNFLVKIKDVQLEGRRNFIIGRNGAGKTTLLQSIAGIIDAEGELLLNSHNLTNLPPENRGVAMIPQDLLLFPALTVEENLKISIKYGKGDQGIYTKIIAEMELNDLLLRRASEISQGQAQRVAIARAIISKPKLLLMDEAFSFQDNIARLGMIGTIEDLSREYEFDYIYATHDPADLENGFSNLVSIDKGDIVENTTSLQEIRHFRTLSLLGFKNLIQIDNKFFAVDEKAISFSNLPGIEYDVVGNGPSSYLRIKIDGKYFFISSNDANRGRYLNIDKSMLREIEY